MSELVERIERELTLPKRSPAQRRVRAGVFLFFLIATPLLLVEIALRLAGFYRPLIPLAVQSQTQKACVEALNRRFDTDAFEPDRYLLWKLKPGSNLAGLDVNELGILGEKPQKDAAGGQERVRVLCLGDSLGAVSYRTFPQIAQRLVEKLSSSRRVEILNASVCGYTSEQGIRLFDKLRGLHPQLVVLCYGWNDHFPALNLPDKELGARGALAAFCHETLRWSRLYQYCVAPRQSPKPDEATSEGLSLRVPPEEFAENLRSLARAARQAGAAVVLATQPENLTEESSAYFVGQGFAPSHRALLLLKRRYNAIVRSVAAETHATLLDMEEEFDRRSKGALFQADGMHLSGPGHNLAARLLVGGIRNQRFLSEEEFQRVVQGARYDTTAADKPHATWGVEPSHLEGSTTQTLRASVLVKNTGNTRWLARHVAARFGARRNVDYGGVSVIGNWRTEGALTSGPATRVRLSHDLLSGEATSLTLVFAAPAHPGDYALEIGLVADTVGELKHLGAEVTTLTVSVHE